MIVVDASVIASALGDAGDDGADVRRRLWGERLLAPEILDLEVASAWRRLVRSGTLESARAAQAMSDLAELPIRRAPHRPLMPRIWQLRENLTPYDAAYVALAEVAEAPLVTRDAWLARAPGLRCQVDLL